MADYSAFLFNSLDRVGDTFANKRRHDRDALIQDRNYARQLGLDQYSQGQDARMWDWRSHEAARDQGNADRNFSLAQKRLAEGPALPQSYVEYKLMQDDPAYAGYVNSRDRKGMSVTEKKALFEAEDDIANIDNTLKTLELAEGLNSKTYSGAGAGIRGTMGAKLPDWMVPDAIASPEGGAATNEWQNVMSMEAVKTMADTLKGATTDFELNTFVGLLADPSTPPEIRARTIARMKQLAARKRQILDERMGGVRDQTYFQPGGGAPAPERPAPPPGSVAAPGGPPEDQASLIQEANEAIAAGADPAAVRAALREMGIEILEGQ